MYKRQLYLWPYLAISVNNIFGCCQFLQSHRASGVKLLGADTDFRTETEFKAVGKTGRRVDIDGCRIDFFKKSAGIVIVLCNNGFGMFCIIFINMVNGLVNAANNFCRQYVVCLLYTSRCV